MRVGRNPSKEQPVPQPDFFHQVVLPIYIPKLGDYYEESFEVLKLCLESLFKTCHSNTFITVVNNGSCKEIENFLDSLYKKDHVQEIIHTYNTGKLNAILKGVCGHRFSLITIADADTLFLTGWQKASYNIFQKFPKAGVVGLTPQFRMYYNYSANVLFDNLFSKSLRFETVKNPEAMKCFYKSIDWGSKFNKDHLKQALTLKEAEVSALVGAGHFVATYKGRMFNNIPVFLNAKLGRNTEQYLDKLPLIYDLWRLTTAQNYAYHMGNAPEEWMREKLKNILPERVNTKEIENYSKIREISSLTYFIKNRVFSKFLRTKFFYRFFLSLKGLPKNMISTYNSLWEVKK